MSRYPNVLTRLLAPEERALSTRENETPLVIEANGRRDMGFLKGFLDSHSSELIADAASHGAVLLRGFDVASDRDFEASVLSIRGMRGIDRVFMAEEGRTIVAGARYVMHTNSIYTTGGSVEHGEFHSENYFVPDVPRFIFFFCGRPSWLGGETGLVNTAGLYADLRAASKSRLESTAFLAATYVLADVAQRYGLSHEDLRRFCGTVGLTIREHKGKEFILMHKPSVFVHPLTAERALNIHFWSGLLKIGIRPAIRRAFMPDYNGAQWAVHQLFWRVPALNDFVPSLTLIKAPRIAIRNFREMLRGRMRTLHAKLGAVAPNRGADDHEPEGMGVDTAFESGDQDLLASAMRRRFSSFRWKRGDVLMVDNLKMAHGGMPGFGPRLLRAMICNPMQVPCSADTPGLWAVPKDHPAQTVGEKIVEHRRA
jgi:alpha-ketoglutarate-dependent taurine dioxygenase